MSFLSSSEWDEFLRRFPDVNLLQTSGWGELKSSYGWQPAYVKGSNSGAMVLFRGIPLGFTIAYIPKGPVGRDWSDLWPSVDQLSKEHRAIFLKVEPDVWENASDELDPSLAGFRYIPHSTIQPQRTLIISLRGSEEEWLARMKQKTRYNIRLAMKKDVQVQPSNDINAFSTMMEITGERDGFGVHRRDYYKKAYEIFHPRGECELLLANFEGKPLAGLMVFAHGSRSWFLFGGSSNEERNRMPAYLLQWEAMRWAASRGCLEYDLWGTPDEDEETLENNFQNRSSGLWSVYRFKRGFGGELRRSIGAWEKVYMPGIYRLLRWRLEKRSA
jgi:peptidoglycan pentaglycine glycine transferase (the first glycine)